MLSESSCLVASNVRLFESARAVGGANILGLAVQPQKSWVRRYVALYRYIYASLWEHAALLSDTYGR